MKKKYFGNKINEDDLITTEITNDKGVVIRKDVEINTEKLAGNNLEFFTAADKFSARTLNRPLIEMLEDVENIYEILQNSCKLLYGQKENGVFPDIFEEMDPRKITTGQFLDIKKRYIRIPTGAFMAKLPDSQEKYYKYTKTEDNQHSRDFYIDNDHNSIFVVNKPNSDLFERQLAEHFNFNLNDQDNDIRLYYRFITDSVGKVDEEAIKASLHQSETETEKEFQKRVARTIEEAYIKNNDDLYNRKNNLSYYLKVTKTSYNYSLTKERNVVLENEPIVSRVPVSENEYCENSFELLKSFNGLFGNYLTKKDDMFSLEETIEVPMDIEWESEKIEGEYKPIKCYIVYDPRAEEVKKEDKNFVYSFSKRYILVKAEYFDSPLCTSKNDLIKLFEFGLTNVYQHQAGEFETVYGWERSVVSNAECFLKKIDRTTFDIKNVNITNLMNDLVIENRKNNINISEAHIKPKDNEKDNISIGFNNLGYTDGLDRTLDSEGDKSVLGNNNISIGTGAMKNTATVNKKNPENNIAIGKNTLENIKAGKNNIEIGYGFGNFSNSEELISIGKNITSSATLNKQNIIIGGDNINANNSVLNEKNTVTGFNNNVVSSSYGNATYGNDNSIIKENNDNFVIGDKNNYDTTDDIGINNDNFIVGNENKTSFILNDNFIVGNRNNNNLDTKNLTINDYGDKNLIFGHDNNFSNTNNISIGNNNEVIMDNGHSIGDKNNFRADADIFSIGSENKIDSSLGNFSIGNNNEIKNGEKDFSIGNNNTLDSTLENYCMGRYNTLKATEHGSIIGSNNSIQKNTYPIVISNNVKVAKKNDKAIILGTDYNDANGKSAEDYDLMFGPQNGIRYLEDNTATKLKKSSWYLRIYNDEVFIRNKQLVVANGNTVFKGSVALPILEVNKYITQDASADKLLQLVDEKTGIPNSGHLTADEFDLNEKFKWLAKYKTFFGSFERNGDDRNFIISIRNRNGYGASNNINTLCLWTSPMVIGEDKHINYCISCEGMNKMSDRQLLDTYGNQEILNSLTIDENLRVKKQATVRNLFSESNGIFDGYIYAKGKVTAESFVSNSARSLKTDIRPTKYNAVEEINKVNVVDFYFKSDTKKENPRIGFIADDTEPILSTKNKNSMDHYNCIGMLLKAVQELSAENKELKERIEKLENK